MGDVRTPENATLICEALSDGVPLRRLCRENGFGKSAIYDWLASDPEFAGRFAEARARGFDAIAEEALELIDDRIDDPDAASRRVRLDGRLKLLAKWDPKRYGDKVALTDTEGGKLGLVGLVAASHAPDTE